MMFIKNTLVLFDIDGTLTDARRPIDKHMMIVLRELARYAEIGFITGSGLEYVKEQLWSVLNDPIIKRNCHIFPCNGTEYVIPQGGDDEMIFHRIKKASMIDSIGSEHFKNLMRTICKLQAEMVAEFEELPLTGHFVQNRGSTINWCPIGRNAIHEDRKLFRGIDCEYNIRLTFKDRLEEEIHKREIPIVVKLGGDTSFDIYPEGWDKTYVFNHFDEQDWDFWFVGDRCSPVGNDYEIFKHLQPIERAFETGSPKETIEIIENYIINYLDNDLE
jgi:phosphomannomutase